MKTKKTKEESIDESTGNSLAFLSFFSHRLASFSLIIRINNDKNIRIQINKKTEEKRRKEKEKEKEKKEKNLIIFFFSCRSYFLICFSCKIIRRTYLSSVLFLSYVSLLLLLLSVVLFLTILFPAKSSSFSSPLDIC